MSDINTFLGKNYNWIIYRNGYNRFSIALTNSGAAFDLSNYTFTLSLRTPNGDTDKLVLTEGDGITNNGATGILDFDLFEADLTSLPRDRYFFVIEYELNDLTYPLIQGYTTISSETNPGSATTSITIPVNVSGVTISAALTLATVTTPEDIQDMVNDAVSSAEISSDMYVNVDAYGAVGDGSTDDKAAIALAITAAGTNGVIRLTPDKIYILNNTITLLTGQTLIGYGATIKRSAATKTTLASAAALGATSLSVVSSAGFAVGDKLIITDSTSPNGGLGRDENSANTSGNFPHTITAINGNTITVTPGISLPVNGNLTSAGEFAAGENVVRVFDMVIGSTYNKVLGITFDGNKANNNYTNSWTMNYCIHPIGQGGIVQHCTFHDMPCENMIIDNNTKIIDNIAYDLNGSFTHISSANTTEPFIGRNIQSRNHIHNVCLVSQDINGHNEGAFTCSNRSIKTHISDNILTNCGNAVFGKLLGSTLDRDSEVYIHNNEVYGANGVMEADIFGDESTETVVIQGNHFEDCNWLYIANDSPNLKEGFSIKWVEIQNNTFINTYALFHDVSDIIVTGNKFVRESGYTYLATATHGIITRSISLSKCVNVLISDNTFENRDTGDDVLYAILIVEDTNSQRIKTDASTASDYKYFTRNVRITNNIIQGYKIGIDLSDATTSGTNYSLVACAIENNTIILREASSTYAIRAFAGMSVSGNTIYGNGSSDCGIRCIGLVSTKDATINGPVVSNNKIYGITNAIKVGHSGQAANNHNILVLNNIITGSVQDNTSGNSTVSGTVTLPVAAVPLIRLARQDPSFY